MNTPTTIELKNIESEDIDDVLRKVEKSFGFRFGDTELKDVKTFGELCDIITNKVQGDNANDCTTQQAFYKLRNAIAAALCIHKENLTIHTRLQKIFPKRQRRRQVKAVEKLLGFKTKVLRPKHWLTTTLAFLLVASFIGLFISWQAGLAGLVFCFAALYISNKLGKEFDETTLEQLAEKIARENYKKVRRNPATVNRKEVGKKVKELFMTDLDLEGEALTGEATFV